MLPRWFTLVAVDKRLQCLTGYWPEAPVPYHRDPSSQHGSWLATERGGLGDRSSMSYKLSLDVTYLPFSSILLVVLTNPDTAQKELHKDMNVRRQGSLGAIWRMDISVILSKSSCYLSD